MQKLFAPLLLLVFMSPLFGQSNYAGLTGSVTDAQHLPIQGPAYRRAERTRLLTQNWQFSMVYQVQSGMPFTISVFGDTANSGTVGENPIRANRTGQPLFGRERTPRRSGSIQEHSWRRQPTHLEMWGETPYMDRHCKRWTSRWCAPCESPRN